MVAADSAEKMMISVEAVVAVDLVVVDSEVVAEAVAAANHKKPKNKKSFSAYERDFFMLAIYPPSTQQNL